MFNFNSKARIQHALAEVDALDRSQAVIEFDLDGTILDANENLLKMSGYSLAEISRASITASSSARPNARAPATATSGPA
ncbi:PAS domain-containing protein [Bradyrhizobium sp. S3.14.4]